MIDLHCHILPGIDDGAKTLEDSLDMARKAISQGITHLMCTPHHNNGKYFNPADQVIEKVAVLQQELDDRNLGLTLLEGQEVRITGTLLEDIARGEILFTDLDDTYILIEFPTGEVPAYTKQLFFNLLSQGHTPVIVHPERNAVFRKNPNDLIPFLEMGVLTQLTAPSIVGVFGKEIQKTAKQMLKHNMLYMVASDAHNLRHRNFYLKEAYEEIKKEQGQSTVVAMQQMTKALVNGDPVTTPDFIEIKEKKFKFFG
ncbi:tyrosine-protein phosphatase [Enterococcus xiangfangensis]|uniref:Tyrosine-protein phosphatase n=1 Tax=Enterococcus xiangfangensis TaxID=1296537 RepID=A0ABU3F7K8_9ENTE|nr:CpsB/CapC family capsule biosynthesis tyrosine phosphatase [Enterococcus xiangfangensis]MDT2758658.1 tyrosine protein phosphatase [Enterococcus xiangfangensis]